MTRLLPLALLAALAAGCHTGTRPPPAPTSIHPARTVEGGAVAVTISGEGFAARAFTDFERTSGSRSDATFTAVLGTTSLRQVRLAEDGTLTAVVPEGLAPGTYDLLVTDPWGHTGALSGAFRVVAVADLDEVVAGFRVAPIGPQRAGAAFDVTVTAVDSDGAEVPYFNRALTLTDLTGTAAPGTVGLLVFGKWTGRVQVDAAHPADVLRVQDDRGRTGESAPFAVAGRAAAGLRFATDPRQVLAGDCSQAVTVRLVDLAGFALPASQELALELAGTPTSGLSFFQDAACAVPLEGLRLAAGGSSATFHFRDTRAGRVELRVGAAGLQGDAQLQTVRASTPTHVAWGTAPLTVVAGSCSAPAVLEAQDASGNPAVVGMSLPVALSADPAAGFALFADEGCTTPLGPAALEAGTSSVTVHFRSTRAGTVHLSASTAELGSDSQAHAVVAAAPAKLAFVTPEQTLVTGDCSAPAVVELRDEFGNAAVPSTPTVALAAAPATGLQFFAGPGCTAPATAVDLGAGSRATFWFSGTVEADFTLTASQTGVAPAAQAAHLRPPLPDRLAFVSAPQTLTAGECSKPTIVEARDPAGTARTVTADTLVALSAAAGSGLSFFSDAGCTVAATSVLLGSGTSTTTFHFRGVRAGARAIDAAVAGWQAASQPVQIDPAAATQLAFRTPPRATAAGECSAAVTLGINDGFGNLAPPPFPTTVSLSATPPTGFRLFTDPACQSELTLVELTAAAPSADLYFVGTRAGQVTLLAQTSAFGTDAQIELVSPKLPDRIVFTTPPRSITAGSCSELVTVQAQDTLGNPVAAAVVTPLGLDAPASGLSFFADGSCAAPMAAPAFAAGSDTVTFYARGTLAGSFTLAAAAFGSSASQAFSVAPAGTTRLAWGPVPSPQGQQVPFRVRLEARDAYDNPTPAFSGTAMLLVVPAGTVACHQGCTDASTTAPFEAGVWRGEVRVGAAGNGRRLVAVSGSLSTTSSPFDVVAGPSQSAPLARLTASPALVILGDPLALDASASSDHQGEALEASFDADGTAAGPAPWGSWSTTLSASATPTTTGTLRPRVAVQDPGGESSYASTVVLVVGSSEACRVTTGAPDDDGATACDTPGPDGVLSLPEAVRLANASATPLTIGFSGPMTARGASPLRFTRPVRLAGGRGVVVLAPLEIAADVGLFSLTLEGQGVQVEAGATLSLEQVDWYDSQGLVVRGAADLVDVRVEGCAGACITDSGGSQLSLRRVQVLRSTTFGLHLASCAVGASPVEVLSSVFSRFVTGVRADCDRTLRLRHVTFDAGTRAVQYAGGAGHELQNAVFAHQSVEAAACGTATFAQRSHLQLFANLALGCLGGAPDELSTDPLFVFPAGRDYRLGAGSPAVDSALDLSLDLNGAAPGDFFGSGPDRGGRESR